MSAVTQDTGASALAGPYDDNAGLTSVQEMVSLFQHLGIFEDRRTHSEEPLDSRHFVLFPLRATKVWYFYKEAEHRFWTAESLIQPITYGPDEGSRSIAGCVAAVAMFLSPMSTLHFASSSITSAVDLAEARSFLGLHSAQAAISAETLEYFLLDLCPGDVSRCDLLELVSASRCNRMRRLLFQLVGHDLNLPTQDVVASWMVLRVLAFSSLWPVIYSFTQSRVDHPLLRWSVHAMTDCKLAFRFAMSLLESLGEPINAPLVVLLVKLAVSMEDVMHQELSLHQFVVQGQSSLLRARQLGDNILRHLTLDPIFGTIAHVQGEEDFFDSFFTFSVCT